MKNHLRNKNKKCVRNKFPPHTHIFHSKQPIPPQMLPFPVNFMKK